MRRIAILAAQAYRNRWQIERSFETVKQEFSLEKLRVRTFRRLRNVFSLCVVAYLFVTRYLRASSRFKGIVKAIRDNCKDACFRVSAEGPDGLGGKSRPVLGRSGNIFRPMFSGVP